MAALTRAEALPGTADEPDGVDERLRERLRTLLCCALLTLLATATRPGRIIADTKIDMAVNPLGFLGRALHLWDIEQFGQLQNQVSGYLFPMGPFYALAHLAGMPPWITQRLWLATLLCTAFLGARRLAGRLAIGTPTARLIGALAYALGPHGLASLGTNSSEYLPLAMLPWMVLPLVGAAHGGGRVRAAARSGLAVACCGGINATATLAVLVVPVLYVLTRTGRPRLLRARLLAWWTVAVGCATAWWSVPLLLLGRYAYSWLLYTEKAATTTATTGPANVLRGSERWVNFLVVDGRAWWPLGHAFATETAPILCTGLIAALGLAGLMRAGLPERTFLILTLLTGLTVMVAGHAGPLALAVRDLIDGPLAPLRNLYKFDGLVRLPLALGVAHLLSSPRRSRRPWAAVGAAAALAGVMLSALSTGLSADGDFPKVPQYWREAAAWLNGRAGEQGVMVVPGARFGEYLWGRPMDEITQPLLNVRWGERQLVPAGSAGLTRMMDAIDQRITTGQGSQGLTEVLARMGVRYLLVRNDLQRSDLRGAWPARVHQALDASPGIRRVAWFGDVPAGSTLPDDAVGSPDQPYAPVEIYEVGGADDAVGLLDADRALRLYGSPEALLTLADNGLLGDRPVLFGDDDPNTTGRSVVADSLRRVERDFGELRGHTSPTLTTAERATVPATRRDILESGWDRYSTVAAYSGIRDVTASASASDVTSPAELDQSGALPYAALDGDPRTRWESGGWTGPVGQWLRVDFDHPLTPRNVTAMFAQDDRLGPPPDEIAVETETGRIVQRLARTSPAQPLRVPAGATRWLRIRVLSLTARPAVPAAARVAVPELHIDGVHAAREYRLPSVPAGATVVMSRTSGGMPACMQGSVRWVCSPFFERRDEEPYGFDRVFAAARTGTAKLSGTATLTDPGLIQRYTSTDPRLKVTASSTLTGEPATLPRAAFDADPATTWVPATGDRAPWLSLAWKRKIRVGRITVRRPAGAAFLTQVRLEGDDGQWREAPLDDNGRLSFKPMRTGHLTLRFSGLPQITDVTVPGVPPFRTLPGARVPLPCGFGPRLRLGGTDVPTRATGTYADLLQGRPIRFHACRTVTVRAGDDRLTPVPFDTFRVDSAVLSPVGAAAAADHEPAPVTVTRWTSEHRQVEVSAQQASYLVVNENANAGWQAKIGGRTLRPVRIDGWRQAWAVPAGTIGTVHLSYTPDRTYQASVLAGLNFLLILLIAARWPSRHRPDGEDARDRAAEPESAPRGTVSTVITTIAGAVGTAGIGFWAGGITASAVALVAVVVFAASARVPRVRPAAAWLPAAAMLAATASLTIGLRLQSAQNSWGAFFAETLPGLLCLLIVARLIAALAGFGTPARSDGRRSRGPRRSSESPGR
ncbi:alpha-(1-_3)-arabinofuranosyltransferase [Actinoallomurus purpureus]|uniref:alpha-(1->3)-arabinofuranosyltransferase domain-containing protein n=1 Tax=Actinoallomurus purpureus TaxID=478114 RepID=UPI0020923163|nr:alpha-(1->3)-arabinofuranosyltransferase family protein [Actinoallomurus purpureus]MCO6005980.1 alpha-(1->3)-arabinofuranosyltransferase [Actinoallomurus purpureus]